MNRGISIILVAVFYFALSKTSNGGDLLFARATRNYDHDGIVGQAYRREFETRMFMHSTWRQRLYCETADVQANETIEIFTKADGSRWLSVRWAKPALSPLIKYRPLPSQRLELAKELDRIQIANCEVALSHALAQELENLWETMLPGVDVAPLPRAFPVHGPTFIGFARHADSVKTGSVCLAAHGTEAYSRFVEIVDDLKRLCKDTEKSKQTVMAKLPAKIRNLTARLGG